MTFKRVLAAWLALSLLLAQTLVLVHRVAHAHGSGVPVAAKFERAGAPASEWTARLFGHHDSESACHLFDGQASDGAPATPLAIAVALPSFFYLAFALGEVLARWAALFDARGPPLPAC
jgi:hypothetical protein